MTACNAWAYEVAEPEANMIWAAEAYFLSKVKDASSPERTEDRNRIDTSQIRRAEDGLRSALLVLQRLVADIEP
jgi:hypothetical protein